MTLKPFAVLLAVALLGYLAWRARAWRPVAAFGAAMAIPVALVYGWLALVGGLVPFVQLLLGYVRPYYGTLGQQPLGALFPLLLTPYVGPLGRALARVGLGAPWAWMAVLAVVASALALTTLRLKDERGPWRTLALWGLAYGLAHYLLQGKGWAYHTYPLAAFGCVLASAWLRRDRPWAAGAAIFLVLFAWYGAKAGLQPDRPWVKDKLATVDALVADLKPVAATGARVQVMDTTGGGIHALFRLKVAEPTPYIYDFHFYHPLDATILAMRARYVAELEAARPGAIVVFKNDGIRFDYTRLDEFPALARLLAKRYRLAVERPAYRVYALN